jgi:hypothetical protein
MPSSPQLRAESKRILSAISKLGPVVPGSLLERSLKCSNARCRCHSDPPVLHGPYWYWTRKVNNKTVSQMLSLEQVADYQPWFENERKLRGLVSELEALGVDAIESDQRSKPRRKRSS